jgi:predicted secreted protein
MVPDGTKARSSVVPADSIELAAGEEVRIPLAGAGSVGYVWDVETDRDGVVAVTVEPAATVSRPASGPPPPSGSLQEVAVVRALQPGTVAITLSLRRPWEPERPPREVRRLEVTVRQRGAGQGS